MAETTLATNAYWDAVRHHIKSDEFYGGPCIDWAGVKSGLPQRFDLVRAYAWSITDPDSVEFVRAHAGPRLIDPLAGTGWWARLLTDAGIDVLATDASPADGTDANSYHKGASPWCSVLQADAVDSVTASGADRTLLLSWPPYGEPVGTDVLGAYSGDRVIYIGEQDGGCCGDEDMFGLLAACWTEVAERRPIQWWGMHDYITVFDRKGGGDRG